MNDLFQTLQSVGNGLAAAGSMAEWLSVHREEFVNAIQTASFEQARAMLHQLCIAHPEANGVIAWLMTSDVESAIAAIGIYDLELATALRDCKVNFEKLQARYA